MTAEDDSVTLDNWSAWALMGGRRVLAPSQHQRAPAYCFSNRSLKDWAEIAPPRTQENRQEDWRAHGGE